jgi:hypothetical protein
MSKTEHNNFHLLSILFPYPKPSLLSILDGKTQGHLSSSIFLTPHHPNVLTIISYLEETEKIAENSNLRICSFILTTIRKMNVAIVFDLKNLIKKITIVRHLYSHRYLCHRNTKQNLKI